MRRGASFETWLRKRGCPADVAEEWAAHAVWATGYAAGRWNKVLFDATLDELHELANTGWADWERVGPAVTAWFDWLRGSDDEAGEHAAPPGRRLHHHPSGPPRLRLVEGGKRGA